MALKPLNKNGENTYLKAKNQMGYDIIVLFNLDVTELVNLV
jgi:hypothetical protein